MKKDNKFNWDTEQQNVFDTLKEKLISILVLNYPDFNRQFFLVTTNASNYTISTVAGTDYQVKTTLLLMLAG